MIKRVVKMQFRTEEIKNFEAVFEYKKEKILAFEGCKSVELLKDIKLNNVFFTISVWENEDLLNEYRNSTFFQETWANVKLKFEAPPQAWSLSEIA
jgi:quinol monooxygenase YgiN